VNHIFLSRSIRKDKGGQGCCHSKQKRNILVLFGHPCDAGSTRADSCRCYEFNGKRKRSRKLSVYLFLGFQFLL